MHGQILSQILSTQLDSQEQQASVDFAALSFLKKKHIPSKLFLFDLKADDGLEARLQRLRELLKASLLAHMCPMNPKQKEQIEARYYELSKLQSSDFQLEILCLILAAHLLKLPHDKVMHMHQLNSGIFPLSKHGYWNLFKYPFAHLHAEFATLLLIAGKLMNHSKWIAQASLAAKWHMNVLSGDYLPFRSLFSNFHFCSYFDLVAWQGTLFHLTSLATEDKEMAFVAKKHFAYLQDAQTKDSKIFPVELLLLLQKTDSLYPQQLTPIEPNLDAMIHYPDLPLMGQRHKKFNIISTVSGCNTSLGALQFADVEIVGYGPQKGHLGDPQFFGTLPNSHVKEVYQHYQSEHSYCLQAVLGLPSTNPNPYLRTWQHPSSWLKTKLQLQDDVLHIQVQPIAVDSKFYFTFYVIAEQCLIKGQKKFLFQSLEQYDGKSSNVAFLSETKMLTIKPSFDDIGMKIIPLEGKASFWGANFLIAYAIDAQKGTFQWKITAENR